MEGAGLVPVALLVASIGGVAVGCKSTASHPPVDAASDGVGPADGVRDTPFDARGMDADGSGDVRVDARDALSPDSDAPVTDAPASDGSASDARDGNGDGNGDVAGVSVDVSADVSVDAGGPLSVPLLPDGTGFIASAASGTTQIQGGWYGYSDGAGRDGLTTSGECERAGHPATACSHVTIPAPGSFANVAGKMCTSGIAAQVVAGDGGFPDYTNISGAGIAVDLNVSAGTALPYNARANGVVGFGFDIDVVPVSGLQVGFPTPPTAHDPAFWGGFDIISPVRVGHNEVRWSDVYGPYYLTNAVVFDPTMILSMRFHVPNGTTGPSAYSFCVSNLVALLR